MLTLNFTSHKTNLNATSNSANDKLMKPVFKGLSKTENMSMLKISLFLTKKCRALKRVVLNHTWGRPRELKITQDRPANR